MRELHMMLAIKLTIKTLVLSKTYQPRACSMTRTLARPSSALTAKGSPRAMARVTLSTWAL